MHQVKTNNDQLNTDFENLKVEYGNLQQDNNQKQVLIQKHELDMQQQVETIANLNEEVNKSSTIHIALS